MDKEPLLEIENLSVRYHTNGTKIYAVNGISFSLNRGEILGVVGETGAGKTSIAKAILRILPVPQGEIESGKIVFDGNDLLKIQEKEMRAVRGKRISMIFQDPMTALNPTYTIGKQIMETIALHEQLPKSEIRKKAVHMLETVGIAEDRFDDFPHQFSGGMKQRVVIAMALACEPELLLADEPTTALDVTIQAQVLDLMKNLIMEYGTSVILISHDLGVVAEMCNKVAIVYAGEIMEMGNAEDIYEHASHPYTIGLFNSVPRIDTKDRRLRPIPGMVPNPSELPKGCRFADRCPYSEEKCREDHPSLREVTSGHFIACHRREGI